VTDKEILHVLINGMDPYASLGVPTPYWELAVELTREVYGESGVKILEAAHQTYEHQVEADSSHILHSVQAWEDGGYTEVLPGEVIRRLESPRPGESYRERVEEDEDMLSVKEFLGAVEAGLFTDDDGVGHPAKDGFSDPDIVVLPSRLDAIPADATHVVWFNNENLRRAVRRHEGRRAEELHHRRREVRPLGGGRAAGGLPPFPGPVARPRRGRLHGPQRPPQHLPPRGRAMTDDFKPVDGFVCPRCGGREATATPSGYLVLCVRCPWQEMWADYGWTGAAYETRKAVRKFCQEEENMTPENLDAGLEILGKYRQDVVIRKEEQYLVSNVLCEVVSVEDQRALGVLGWEGVDDRVGCKLGRPGKLMKHRLECAVCDLVGAGECPAYQQLKAE
jgi:hypothetical protein